MFNIFKSQTNLEKLQKKYESLMKEWHELSSKDRAKSDLKYAEAQRILDQIEILNKN